MFAAQAALVALTMSAAAEAQSPPPQGADATSAAPFAPAARSAAGAQHSKELAAAERNESAERVDRARFSIGRFLVGSLSGAVVGSAAGYFTYKSICGDEGCIGGALAGMGANVTLTPLSIFGAGRAMGGQGGLWGTYLGGMLPFVLTTGLSSQSPELSLAIGMTAIPFASAVAFELSSRSSVTTQPVSGVRPSATQGPSLLGFALMPLTDRRGVLRGGTLMVTGRF